MPTKSNSLDDIVFSHLLTAGGCTETGYGIIVAEMQGLSPDVITKAKAIGTMLEAKFAAEALLQNEDREMDDDNGHAQHELANLLLSVPSSSLPDDDLRAYLKELKTRFFV